MGFNLGMVAGVLYALRNRNAPQSRLTKHLAKCKANYAKKDSITFHNHRVGQLLALLVIGYLHVLMWEIGSEMGNNGKTIINTNTTGNLWNATQVSNSTHSFNLRALNLTSHQPHPIHTAPAPTPNFLPAHILLLLVNLLILLSVKLQFTVLTHKKLTIRSLSRKGYSKISFPVESMTDIGIIKVGSARFTEQSERYVLRIGFKDTKKRLELTETISLVVAKRRYIEVMVFLGREVQVQAIKVEK